MDGSRQPSAVTANDQGSASMGQRQWLRPVLDDVFAGLTVAGVLLPEAVAYAAIANVPPAHALLAALVGLCLYPWFGSSRFAIVSPTSSAAAIFASAVAVGGMPMGFALVILTGGLLLLAWALRAEFLGAFVSRPVLRGFAWALALTIIVRQLPHLLGMQVSAAGFFPLLQQLWHYAALVHGPSLVWGLAALVLWLVFKRLHRWLLLPPSLLILMAGMIASAILEPARAGVALVGQVAWAWSGWHWPHLSDAYWLRAAEIAPALLLILFAESWGSVRTLALQHGDRVAPRRELLALGLSNLASGALQGLPVGAGFSASSANEAAGGRSKLTGLAAALALALLLWQGRGWLALLPVPVLAAVVIGILAHGLWPRTVLNSMRLRSDTWLAWVAAATVLVFGVLFGLLLAVGLSVLLVVRRFSRPLWSELGQLPGTRDYLDRDAHTEALRTPGVTVLRPEEPVFFANAERIFAGMREQALAHDTQVLVLSMELCDALDSTSVEALAELATDLSHRGCTLMLARVKDRPRDALHRAGLLDGSSGVLVPVFWSVDDAVEAAQARLGPAV